MDVADELEVSDGREKKPLPVAEVRIVADDRKFGVGLTAAVPDLADKDVLDLHLVRAQGATFL